MKNPLRSPRFYLFVVIVLAIWIVLSPFIAARLITQKEIDSPDAILVLAGSAAYRERSALAAQLFNRGAAPRILLTDDGRTSGWSDTEKENLKYVELARRELVADGVPEDRITILEGKVSGTIDEARIMCASAAKLGLTKILLVTSGYHSKRALHTFEATAANESKDISFGISSVAPGIDTPAASVWWLSMKGWEFVAGEYVKAVYYETLF